MARYCELTVQTAVGKEILKLQVTAVRVAPRQTNIFIGMLTGTCWFAEGVITYSLNQYLIQRNTIKNTMKMTIAPAITHQPLQLWCDPRQKRKNTECGAEMGDGTGDIQD